MSYAHGFMRGALIAAALTLSTGCVWLSGYDREGRPLARHFQVDLSGLDWIELTYMPRPNDPVFTLPCRLSLYGSGEIVFRTGRSPQLWDSFSVTVDDPHWNDLYVDRRHVSAQEMQDIFQSFVDAGVFPARQIRGAVQEMHAPFVKINAKIGHKRALRFLEDRRVVGIVERLLEDFAPTAARRATPGGAQP